MEIAAEEVLVNGFRSTSLDQILRRSGVTKGALYYHFRNKKELGLAMVAELYREYVSREWREGLARTGDPVDDLLELLRKKRSGSTEDSVRCGCPLNNLAQEMAAVDEDFRRAIESIFAEWRTVIAEALERGKRDGKVRENVDSAKAAIFIIAVIEGSVGAAKNARNPALLDAAVETLQVFVETLRPGRRIRSAA